MELVRFTANFGREVLNRLPIRAQPGERIGEDEGVVGTALLVHSTLQAPRPHEDVEAHRGGLVLGRR